MHSDSKGFDVVLEPVLAGGFTDASRSVPLSRKPGNSSDMDILKTFKRRAMNQEERRQVRHNRFFSDVAPEPVFPYP
jgi:hypothetical protein